ncbi:leucine-rich repeat-containing protein 38 [Suricata suricatta]|uniref:leucine-rich repeat-containing protein 38 n=1 Tax=Suricata suricatta TaxID=37032 RepID=UPI001156057F|nr:leucine-rich repeat-containing protein 38 [Suricata suricatta]
MTLVWNKESAHTQTNQASELGVWLGNRSPGAAPAKSSAPETAELLLHVRACCKRPPSLGPEQGEQSSWGVREGTFSGSAKLAFLDLSYNNLTQLGAGAFRSAGRLVKLSLANNNLAGVHEAAFETLESLQVLELNDNNLRSLNVATLAALPALRTLRLDGNPWLCDCDFAHLFSWIQENASKLPKGHEEIQCSLPLGNRRIFLHELSEASFSECRFNLSLTDLFIIIFSGVAVSIAAIISSFFLATVVQCFQRCAPNKDTEDEEDEDEDD